MRKLLPALVLTAVLAAPGRVVAQSVAPATASAPDPALGPGDIVRVTVWRKPELSGEFTIAADGGIRHPLYQGVKVTGLPISEATRRLNTFLATYEQNPQILIEPLFRITVGGEVRSPNVYNLGRETTLSQAIALAGGPTERGALGRVRLVRTGSVVTVDLMDPGTPWTRAPVNSGDQILVPRRRDTLRDVVIPVFSVAGGLAAIAGLFLR